MPGDNKINVKTPSSQGQGYPASASGNTGSRQGSTAAQASDPNIQPRVSTSTSIAPKRNNEPLKVVTRTAARLDMPGFKSPTFGTNTYDGVKALYAGRTVPLELVRPYTPAALRLAAEHAVQDIGSYQFNFKNDQAQREVQSALAHVRDLMSGADANDPEALQEVRDALVTLTHGLPGKLKSEKVPIPNARGRFWQGVKMPSSLLQAAGSLYEDKLHAEVTLPSLERRLSRLPQSYQERDPGGTFVNAVDVAKEAIQFVVNAMRSEFGEHARVPNIAFASARVWFGTDAGMQMDSYPAMDAKLLALGGYEIEKVSTDQWIEKLAAQASDPLGGNLGFVYPAATPTDKELVGAPVLRDVDGTVFVPSAAEAEEKVLAKFCKNVDEHLKATNLGPDCVRGTLFLASDFSLCASCSRTLALVREKYPNLEVIALSTNKNWLPGEEEQFGFLEERHKKSSERAFAPFRYANLKNMADGWMTSGQGVVPGAMTGESRPGAGEMPEPGPEEEPAGKAAGKRPALEPTLPSRTVQIAGRTIQFGRASSESSSESSDPAEGARPTPGVLARPRAESDSSESDVAETALQHAVVIPHESYQELVDMYNEIAVRTGVFPESAEVSQERGLDIIKNGMSLLKYKADAMQASVLNEPGLVETVRYLESSLQRLNEAYQATTAAGIATARQKSHELFLAREQNTELEQANAPMRERAEEQKASIAKLRAKTSVQLQALAPRRETLAQLSQQANALQAALQDAEAERAAQARGADPDQRRHDELQKRLADLKQQLRAKEDAAVEQRIAALQRQHRADLEGRNRQLSEVREARLRNRQLKAELEALNKEAAKVVVGEEADRAATASAAGNSPAWERLGELAKNIQSKAAQTIGIKQQLGIEPGMDQRQELLQLVAFRQPRVDVQRAQQRRLEALRNEIEETKSKP